MRKTRKPFLIIIAIALVVVSCVALIILSNYAVGYVIRGTRPIPGDTAKFDVLATYPDIVKFAGDQLQLLNIRMKFVKSDGTLDLTADYGAEVSYRFARIVDTPSDAAPLGAGGKPDGIYAERVDVNLEKPDVSGGNRNQYYNFGMMRITIPVALLTESVTVPPTCTPKQLWDVALKNDAPANAVATISYDSDGYDFNIADTSVYLQFDSACNLKN